MIVVDGQAVCSDAWECLEYDGLLHAAPLEIVEPTRSIRMVAPADPPKLNATP